MFGSGDPEVNDDITMYIESADLSARHAQIKYTDELGRTYDDADNDMQGVYTLSDCNSETGTWIKLRHIYADNQNDYL